MCFASTEIYCFELYRTTLAMGQKNTQKNFLFIKFSSFINPDIGLITDIWHFHFSYAMDRMIIFFISVGNFPEIWLLQWSAINFKLKFIK